MSKLKKGDKFVTRKDIDDMLDYCKGVTLTVEKIEN